MSLVTKLACVKCFISRC